MVQVTHACKEKELEGLKEEVRKELKATAGKSSQLLNFIDSIQRLGLAYHFEREIEDALKVMYETYNLVDDNNDDLASAALRFRLLRQGYHIPSGKSFCPIFAASMCNDILLTM